MYVLYRYTRYIMKSASVKLHLFSDRTNIGELPCVPLKKTSNATRVAYAGFKPVP
jgi:hypothetical protein